MVVEVPFRAVVLCGPGNNGGDGFVVARLLKERGWNVEVFLYGDADKLPPNAKVNCERWESSGSIQELGSTAPYTSEAPDLVVDALFGTGLTRALPKSVALAVDTRRRSQKPDHWKPRYVAIDCPTGLNCDTGDARAFMAAAKPIGEADAEPVNFCQLTVTFHSPKVGHYLSDGPAVCTKIKVIDIGLRGDAMELTVPFVQNGDRCRVRLLEPVFCWRPIKSPGFLHDMLEKTGSGHKYSHGHALVLSGGHGNTGAARLAARGALRIGAGLVTLGSPRSAMFENAANLTAIMLRQIDGAAGLTELLEDSRFNALCLGPGLGIRADTQALVLTALKANRPTILDADALSRFSIKPETLFDVLHKDCVITPHGGEFARLFPVIAEKLAAPATTGPAYSKVDATREAAARAGCVVLFKGADTVIAAPDGRCSINSAHYERSAPWLATAGSGDVLAGFIAGLLARGFAPMQAAETGAWLHVECARKFGPGLIAEDLAEQLPAVFRDLAV